MRLFTIVIKNLKKRLLSTTLTIISILLGVAMVISVMVVQAETERSFNQTSVGYDLIFAAKGSQLQATLNTLYHLETSVGVIPYSLYEATRNDPRVEFTFPFYVGDSYRGFRVVGTSNDFIDNAQPRRGQNFEIQSGRNFSNPLEAVLGSQTARLTRLQVGDKIQITHGLQEVAAGAEEHVHDNAPVTIVGILMSSGTANDRVIFTDLYTTHALHDPQFHIDDFEEAIEVHDHSHESDHGDEVHQDGHNHDHHADNHEEQNENAQNGHDHDDHSHPALDQIELKELDAILVKMVNPAAALQVSGLINFPTPANPLLARNMMRDPYFRYKNDIMAVVPAMQIRNLMGIVGNAEVVLRFVAWFVVIVALFGVLIAIYNTMEERKRDLAVMRALGAKKSTIMNIIIMESAFICAIGAFLGLIVGHFIVMAAAPYLADFAGIVIAAFIIDSNQIYLIVSLIVAGVLVGLIPAIKAYRTDAVKNLSSGK
jgi:putative ABC transport system permease protein